jgi:hypothetical protein
VISPSGRPGGAITDPQLPGVPDVWFEKPPPPPPPSQAKERAVAVVHSRMP